MGGAVVSRSKGGQARNEHMLAGKSGVSFFHVGDGRGALAPLRALRDGTDIPLRQLYPTHCNRNRRFKARWS